MTPMNTAERLETYAKSARRIATMVLRTDGLDATASTTQDHVAHLMVEAWEAQRRFLDKGIYDQRQESNWVHRCLWNEAKGVYATRKSRQERSPLSPWDDVADSIPSDEHQEMEDQVFQNQACLLLDEGLEPAELDLLQRYADSGCNIAATMATYRIGRSGGRAALGRKGFTRILNAVREKASRIIAGVDLEPGTIPGVEELYRGEEESEMSEPQCFGVCWDNKEPECLSCAVRTGCLEKLAKGLYPATVAKLRGSGVEPTVEAVAADLELTPEAIAEVKAFAERSPIEVPKPTVAIPEVPPAPPAPVPAPVAVQNPQEKLEEAKVQVEAAYSSGHPVAIAGAEEKLAEAKAEVAAQTQQEPAAEPAAKQEAEMAVEKKEAEAPKEPKPKREKKAKEPKVKAAKEPKAVASVPRKAAPAASVAGAASTPKGRAKMAARRAKEPAATSAKRSASAPSGSTEKRGWGVASERWTRERERNPLVAALTPGVKLKRDYNGRKVEVKVGAGYYLFEGEKYPTLQAVTTAATGAKEYPKQTVGEKRRKGTRTMGNWSAAKFWKLKRLLSQK